jgi:hypothetical protein
VSGFQIKDIVTDSDGPRVRCEFLYQPAALIDLVRAQHVLDDQMAIHSVLLDLFARDRQRCPVVRCRHLNPPLFTILAPVYNAQLVLPRTGQHQRPHKSASARAMRCAPSFALSVMRRRLTASSETGSTSSPSTTPEEHWVHLRTSNPIESVFSGVRLRTNATKRLQVRENALYLVFKLVLRLSMNWRGINAPNQVRLLLTGHVSRDGQLARPVRSVWIIWLDDRRTRRLSGFAVAHGILPIHGLNPGLIWLPPQVGVGALLQWLVVSLRSPTAQRPSERNGAMIRGLGEWTAARQPSAAQPTLD